MDAMQFLDQPEIGIFINGRFSKINEPKTCELISPYTGSPWKTYIPATSADIQSAIKAAQSAFIHWKNTSSPKRGSYLRKLGDLITEHSEIFAELMAYEMGKPIAQGRAEAAYSAGYFYWFSGEAERIYGKTIPSSSENKELKIQYEPLGVCASITPWNFPLAMAARKIAAALAAGCTIINKPSRESPITMLFFAYLCQMAHLPKGVVNITPGPEEEIGKVLLESPIVRKISFTGSTKVGRYLYRESSQTLKKLTMELGGHAPLIIFQDAGLDHAIDEALASKFRNNGQTCICPNRIFVQRDIYDEFLDKFKKSAQALVVGDPLDPKSDLSPILHPSVLKKVRHHIDDAVAKGAEVVLQGKNLYDPCILCDVSEEMAIYREETFGPVAAVIPFSTEEEAIAMANDTEFGLASYLFSSNLSRCKRVADALQYGIVGINDALPSAPQASFGGVKQSGFGREGGPSAIYEYLMEKYLSVQF